DAVGVRQDVGGQGAVDADEGAEGERDQSPGGDELGLGGDLGDRQQSEADRRPAEVDEGAAAEAVRERAGGDQPDDGEDPGYRGHGADGGRGRVQAEAEAALNEVEQPGL